MIRVPFDGIEPLDPPEPDDFRRIGAMPSSPQSPTSVAPASQQRVGILFEQAGQRRFGMRGAAKNRDGVPTNTSRTIVEALQTGPTLRLTGDEMVGPPPC